MTLRNQTFKELSKKLDKHIRLLKKDLIYFEKNPCEKKPVQPPSNHDQYCN